MNRNKYLLRHLEKRYEDACHRHIGGAFPSHKVGVKFLESEGEDLCIVLRGVMHSDYMLYCLNEYAEVVLEEVLARVVKKVGMSEKVGRNRGTKFEWVGRVEGVSSISELYVLMCISGIL